MKIKTATFITSAFHSNDYPADTMPEIAFAGKSNVGKSSLINAVVNRRNLARTSSTPGRTQAINFFSINGEISFVDLPGYGFARVPVEIRRRWKPMVEQYITSRKSLALVVVIVDGRREPTEDDANLLQWLKHHTIPSLVVITKIDKLAHSLRSRQKALIKTNLSLEDGQIILFSAVTGEGKDKIWKRIRTAVAER